MDFISIFFIIMSIVVMTYIYFLLKTKRRFSILIEIFYISIYSFVALIFLFPSILIFIENTLGIASAINFFLYLSIFVAYFLLFILYGKSETQREEITKLVREIAYIKKDKEKK